MPWSRCGSVGAALLGLLALAGTMDAQQQAGSIRGIVRDGDLDVPLAAVEVTNVDTGQKVATTDQGNFVFPEVAPGTYTLIFAKEGYVRQVKSDVVVLAGQLTDVDLALAGEFTDMEEFVVQDLLQLGGGTEAALLSLRLESPALMDSIGTDLMNRAGASDAAAGLRLVAGASVQDGKFAVIRGLPDRYVSSKMNGVRLPSADEDKRAVELDQFPAAVIESLQVSKTFTPDQQGDASGGAVDVRLKGIPDETVLSFRSQVSTNSEVTGRSDFLTYEGGGVGWLGQDDGGRDIQFDRLGANWDGAAGVSTGEAPIDYKWSLDAGGKQELGDGIRVGGFASLFYERDSSYTDKGRDDSYWVENAGDPLTPQISGILLDENYTTALFDVTRAEESVRWGGLGTLGIESENHALNLTYLYTHVAEDVATLAEDTRGKAFFYPGNDPADPSSPGNDVPNAAPYLRSEALQYTERTTGTLQLSGHHVLPWEGFHAGESVTFRRPELSWYAARSYANLDQPDKRLFGSQFLPVNGGLWVPYKPAQNFTLGNFQRLWKVIDEHSDQYSIDLELPFEQWSGEKGSLEFGLFQDRVERSFDQDSFSNFSDLGAQFQGDFGDFWSASFPFEDHPISSLQTDVDYEGDQDLAAWYGMLNLPVTSEFSLMTGVRFESTDIRIVNDPEADATWVPKGATAPQDLEPGEADVSFQQDDVLPAIGLTFEATPRLTLRAAYSETVARQTFKELTPILQQEFLGGPVFVGNPELGMSALENYDLRLDYTPYEGGLLSLSWFLKDVTDPIEYVQRLASFTFTEPRNYPDGRLSGYELELRQDLGRFHGALDGLSLGANATFIDSEVNLPQDEIDEFVRLGTPIRSRDMTNAPEYLYNLYLNYDLDDSRTQASIFYTVQGDTLIAGAGQSLSNFVPSLYAREYGTLNLSLSRRIGKNFKLQLQAKNLTDPAIDTVYRSDFTGDDKTHTSFTKGREFSLSLSVNL